MLSVLAGGGKVPTYRILLPLRYRKMNKRLAARIPGVLLPEDGVPLDGVPRKSSPLTNGIVSAGSGAQLVSRSTDPAYDLGMRKPKMDSAPGSPPDS